MKIFPSIITNQKDFQVFRKFYESNKVKLYYLHQTSMKSYEQYTQLVTIPYVI
jgi:hypothetical protein